MNTSKIEERIDKQAAGGTEVTVAGVSFASMGQVMEFAKLMSIAEEGVPPHLRGKPGTCLAVITQAVEWHMSPFAVANKSYSVNGRLGFESQLVHAVVETRAPLMGRIRHSLSGAGDDLVCTVTGMVRGEAEPFEWTSPRFGDIRVKNSTEWKNNPRKQLYYHTVRDFCRVYFPDILLGIYTPEELREIGPERARDVTPPKPANPLADGPPEAAEIGGADATVLKRGKTMEGTDDSDEQRAGAVDQRTQDGEATI